MRSGTGAWPFCRWARAWLVGVALIGLAACGKDVSDKLPTRSSTTGREHIEQLVLTEADADPDIIEVEYYEYDISLPEQEGHGALPGGR